MLPAVASSIAGSQDTIVARSTAPGRAAIAVIRASGRTAFDLASKLITPWPIEPRRATLCRILDEHGRMIDHGVVTAFACPDSFTGEDIVEVSTHGGNYISVRLISSFVSVGAREAQPGEFTRRAVLNGKMDITQAEAINDLIDARSDAMHKAAVGQMDGGLRRRIEALRGRLLSLAAMIAYDIDFPEEDDGPVSRERISSEVNDVVAALDLLLATVPAGELIREGAIVVIAGEPNVGKSALFNALLGQSRAIVTDIPGTTRDAIEGFVESRNWPVRLVDTAGFRATADTIERLGIEVSEAYLKRAHVVLTCGDSHQSIQRTLHVLAGKIESETICVRTKSDLIVGKEPEKSGKEARYIEVSAETGIGLTSLLDMIDQVLTDSIGSAVAETPVLTRQRHVQAIQQARGELVMFSRLWREEQLPAPVAAVHLQTAVGMLEGLIGAVSTDDVLDRVFSSFCVGK